MCADVRVFYRQSQKAGVAQVYVPGMVVPQAGWPVLFLVLMAGLVVLAALPGSVVGGRWPDVSSDRAGLVPPPIRYPLPTLIAVVFLSVLIWRGEGVIRRTYSALTAPLKRVVNGPDYPKSARPQTFTGAIPRKVLRLRDGVPVRPYPGGQGAQTFRTRGFSTCMTFGRVAVCPRTIESGTRASSAG